MYFLKCILWTACASSYLWSLRCSVQVCCTKRQHQARFSCYLQFNFEVFSFCIILWVALLPLIMLHLIFWTSNALIFERQIYDKYWIASAALHIETFPIQFSAFWHQGRSFHKLGRIHWTSERKLLSGRSSKKTENNQVGSDPPFCEPQTQNLWFSGHLESFWNRGKVEIFLLGRYLGHLNSKVIIQLIAVWKWKHP